MLKFLQYINHLFGNRCIKQTHKKTCRSGIIHAINSGKNAEAVGKTRCRKRKEIVNALTIKSREIFQDTIARLCESVLFTFRI